MKIRPDLIKHFNVNFIPCFLITVFVENWNIKLGLCLLVFIFWLVYKELYHDLIKKLGTFDILDIIANFIGCLAGYGFGMLFNQIYFDIYCH